jgi:hypothetical protein
VTITFRQVTRSLDAIHAPSSVDRGALLSQRLLVALKPSTVELDPGFSYKNSGQYYIDTMGAMSFPRKSSRWHRSLMIG